MYKFIIFFLSAFIVGCTTNTFSPITGEPQPVLKHAVPPQSKVLVVTSLDSEIHATLSSWVSNHSESFVLSGTNINTYAARSAMNALMQEGHGVNAAELPKGEWHNQNLEAAGPQLLRQTIVGFSEGMASGNMVLKPQLMNELHILNAKLHADYILLIISSGANLACTKNTAGPIQLTFRTYLIDTQQDKVLTWRDYVIAEDKNLYSTEKNNALCHAIINNQVSPSDSAELKNWLRYYTDKIGPQFVDAGLTSTFS